MISDHRLKQQSSRSAFQELTLKQRARMMRQSTTGKRSGALAAAQGAATGRYLQAASAVARVYRGFLCVRGEARGRGGWRLSWVALDAKRQRRLERAGYRVVRVGSEVVLRQPSSVLEYFRVSVLRLPEVAAPLGLRAAGSLSHRCGSTIWRLRSNHGRVRFRLSHQR
jgi:hypothetical protein